MINHDTDNSVRPELHERHLGRNAAIALGSATLAAILISGAQSEAQHDIRNNAELSNSSTVEHTVTPAAEHSGAISFHTIEQDEITGKVVERSTQEYADLYDVTLQPGQSTIDFTSAKGIEDAIMQTTGGSVQPGTAFETWLDPSTGYVISTYVPKQSE